MRKVLLLIGLTLALPAAAQIQPKTGGSLTEAQTVFEATGETIRDVSLVPLGDKLHMYVVTGKDKSGTLWHRESADAGKTWSHAKKLATGPPRAAWIKPSVIDGRPHLVIASNPSLPPQFPRLDRFGGKKYLGIVGILTMMRLGADGKTVEANVTQRIENPGNVIYSHHPFWPACRLVGKGDQLTLAGTCWFDYRGQYRVYSIFRTHSSDGGKTWGKPQMMRKMFRALRGMKFLKPAIFFTGGATHLVFGDKYDKKLAHLTSTKGGEWKAAESDLGKLGPWNFWYDGLEDGSGALVTDTIEMQGTKRHGIVVYHSADGKTWKTLRTLDLEMDQAYAALSWVNGKQRAHRVWGTGIVALSSDAGKTWIKTTLPKAFTNGRGALVPGRGYAALEIGEPAAGKQTVGMVVLTP